MGIFEVHPDILRCMATSLPQQPAFLSLQDFLMELLVNRLDEGFLDRREQPLHLLLRPPTERPPEMTCSLFLTPNLSNSVRNARI